jgi:hypothetical protein
VRLVLLLTCAILVAGCPATPLCHCQLSDRCTQLEVDCAAYNVTCNGRDGKDGPCPSADAVGSCVVDDTRTDYFYSPDFTTASADAVCDGFFTPLP